MSKYTSKLKNISEVNASEREARAGKAFGRNEVNLSAFFNTITDFLFVLDMEGNIIEMNDAVVERLGYSRRELIGKSVLTVHPETRRAEAAEIVGALMKGKAAHCPIPLVTKGERQIPVETRVVRGQWNGQDVLFGVSRDITDRIKAEDELRRYRDHLEDMISQRTAELIEKSQNLEDANTALKALLRVREEDRKILGGKVVLNIQKLVIPYLDLLKKETHGSNALLFEILEANLAEIASPFLGKAASLGFTPREVEVANLIRNGRTIKEIAGFLHLSPRSVERHRYHIRKKLQLNDKRVNLFSHLLTLS
jgi:PAS domain S-box-containing protein